MAAELQKLLTVYNFTVSSIPSSNVDAIDTPSDPERVHEFARNGQYIVTANIEPLMIHIDEVTDDLYW